jgi:hypothetical protein
MVIVRLFGGLGNQMFQYAAGLRLARHHGTPFKLDLRALLDRRPNKDFVFRDYNLGIFPIKPDFASRWEASQYGRDPEWGAMGHLARAIGKLKGCSYFYEPEHVYDPRVLNLGDNVYLTGVFQDERYFIDCEKEVRTSFDLNPDPTTLPEATRKLAEEIRGQKSICLHIRRGDCVAHQLASRYQGVASMEYNHAAIAELRSRGADGRVYIFSDDADWCRQTFTDTTQFTVVGDEHAGKLSETHLWLMTLCNYFAIPNSSFSWWAAWLGKREGKIVARPARWNREEALKDRDICPASWLKINVASTFSGN